MLFYCFDGILLFSSRNTSAVVNADDSRSPCRFRKEVNCSKATSMRTWTPVEDTVLFQLLTGSFVGFTNDDNLDNQTQSLLHISVCFTAEFHVWIIGCLRHGTVVPCNGFVKEFRQDHLEVATTLEGSWKIFKNSMNVTFLWKFWFSKNRNI